MKTYSRSLSILSLILALLILSLSPVSIQPVEAQARMSFQYADLQGVENAFQWLTTLQFGPDGRLYVAQRLGRIFALTIERNGVADYVVTQSESIHNIWQDIPNHSDDTGEIVEELDGLPPSRQITGIYATGTAENPVLYVSSSDPREGGGGIKGDLNLDTNSGVISRLTWTGTEWEHVQLVRGLPRSELNHSVNGMAIDENNNIMYLAIGSMGNMGAPSAFFADTPEYAYAGAILAIDLTAIGDNTYDMPTLDDPTRENLPDGSDVNDPFGGNEGLNQARIDPSSPVQLYATGFRNPYDVVLMENGRLYSIDNGPNLTWGGPPIIHEDGTCDNTLNEEGAERYFDNLHLVVEGMYAGHPNPTRANPEVIYGADNEAQSPVPYDLANPEECNYLLPGVDDNALATWTASTNGLVEYTASNFGGIMQGDLLTVSYSGTVSRISLNETGDALVDLTPMRDDDWGYMILFHDFGLIPLDVTAQGDDAIFPGTIWVVNFAAHTITVFEPGDYDCQNTDAGC